MALRPWKDASAVTRYAEYLWTDPPDRARRVLSSGMSIARACALGAEGRAAPADPGPRVALQRLPSAEHQRASPRMPPKRHPAELRSGAAHRQGLGREAR